MRRRPAVRFLTCTAAASVAMAVSLLKAAPEADSPPDAWKRADTLASDGNYHEALTAYRQLLQEKSASTQNLLSGYQRAVQSVQRLNILAELDAF